MTDTAASRLASKSPQHALANRLIVEAGLNHAQVRLVVEQLADHLQQYYGDRKEPGAITHTAVSAAEPAGKPIKHCKVVPVQLTLVHPADVGVLHTAGSVALRDTRIYRLCCEAQKQRGLLSYEDLSVLLAVTVSAVQDAVKRLREQGVVVPTRGAVQDIGPEPSHKGVIAELLGRGKTTCEVRAMTCHSEGSIGRYQHDFALVLHLLHRYPDITHDDRCRISGLSPKAYQVYVEVYDRLNQRPDCHPHLERLRSYYELDPEGLTQKIPPGKAPDDLTRRRLEQQTLCTIVRQVLQHALGTTERVAELVTGDLMAVIGKAFSLTGARRPGEVTLQVDKYDPDFISGERNSDREIISVTVPLYTEQAKELWRSDEPATRRRARLAALVATAAFEQGGIMTVQGLAELLHVQPATLGSDLRKYAMELEALDDIPTKGSIEDAGPTLTHKREIIGLDRHGLTGEQITWLTRHAPVSRDRYITTYRRVKTMMRAEGRVPSVEDVSRLFRLRRHVAQQYLDLLNDHQGSGSPADGSAGTANAPTAAVQ